MAGKFRPGDRLPTERELAEQLKVNRSSVREGLKKLEQLRLVRIQQGSGIRVLAPEEASFDLVWNLIFRGGRPDAQWLRHVLELRETLMPGVLKLAKTRASREQRHQIAELLEQTARGDASDDVFNECVRAFQVDLARLTGNQVLLLLFNALRRGIDEPQLRTLKSSIARERVALSAPLLRLARSIRRFDPPAAEAALGEVMRLLNAAVLAAVAEFGRSGEASEQRAPARPQEPSSHL